MCDLTREQKGQIRKRDAKRIKLTGRCSLCRNTEESTSRHHLWYNPNQFTREAVIEVCDTCDCKIHGRDDNDNWVRTLKSVRSIELKRNKNTDKYITFYDVIVEEKIVGCGHATIDGIKLVIID